MDIVYIIITVMLVCAAACAIVLVWPARPSKERQAVAAERAAPHAGDGGAKR